MTVMKTKVGINREQHPDNGKRGYIDSYYGHQGTVYAVIISDKEVLKARIEDLVVVDQTMIILRENEANFINQMIGYISTRIKEKKYKDHVGGWIAGISRTLNEATLK